MEADSAEDLDTSVKGKQGELIVMGELLQRGYKVYTPMVDLGIDCLVDVGNGNYKEVQIKSRDSQPTFSARKFRARDNFYIICFLDSRRGRDFWVLPSKVFLEKASSGQARGREYLQLRIGAEGSESYEGLSKYHHNWGALLAGATKEVKREVERASKRIEGPHFKQPDYEREVLRILSESKAPMSTKQIISEVERRMGPRFSTADMVRMNRYRLRWENTARFAIYQGLKRRGLIEARTKNQWTLTQKGIDWMASRLK